jgi:hypothetical protein
MRPQLTFFGFFVFFFNAEALAAASASFARRFFS